MKHLSYLTTIAIALLALGCSQSRRLSANAPQAANQDFSQPKVQLPNLDFEAEAESETTGNEAIEANINVVTVEQVALMFETLFAEHEADFNQATNQLSSVISQNSTAAAGLQARLNALQETFNRLNEDIQALNAERLQ